jgi:hypothetical protein
MLSRILYLIGSLFFVAGTLVSMWEAKGEK